jgi:hypothetical protein
MDELDEFLGDQPRAEEWRALRKALAGRLHSLRERQKDSRDDAEILVLASEIEKLEAKVAALRLEEAVAQFVEDSAQATINSAKLNPESDEPEE